MTVKERYIDTAYTNLSQHTKAGWELDHDYGDNYHILADTTILTQLAKLCSASTTQPLINQLISDIYFHMIREVISREFPKQNHTTETRMSEFSDRGFWTGDIIDPAAKAVTVNIARAGTLPSQVCYDFLNKTIDPNNVRQDHVIMARKVNAEGQVTGAHFGESKIGGDIDNAIVIFPDPMGATGGSISEAISHYKKDVSGQAKKFITINLMVTPEFLKRMKTDHPELIVYGARLDRGGSSLEVLQTKPGSKWDQESGLTDKQYIIPGGGGFGEIMNNSYC